MRYAYFSFILIFCFIFLSFCAGCSDQSIALDTLHGQDLSLYRPKATEKIDIEQKKCELKKQQSDLLGQRPK